MPSWWSLAPFVLGLSLGTLIGFVVCALCTAAKKADEESALTLIQGSWEGKIQSPPKEP